ncbi:hypothetical protein EDB92DRAFT_1949364 [Lactarius akahatsu]|uniref:Uncharacterized protein n=1 Tax=Lactarius akahatsu TaxID=416441 RepID=A0AAD4QB66_9AGAM|nr:hypothetical protein EDB92DRAFT_1949364 [Lactarius akahatsu]
MSSPDTLPPIAVLGLNCFNTASTQDTATATTTATTDIGSGLVGDALNLNRLSIASAQDAATTAWDINSELVGNLIATTWDIGLELIGDGMPYSCACFCVIS